MSWFVCGYGPIFESESLGDPLHIMAIADCSEGVFLTVTNGEFGLAFWVPPCMGYASGIAAAACSCCSSVHCLLPTCF